jgi:hypothetical protein
MDLLREYRENCATVSLSGTFINDITQVINLTVLSFDISSAITSGFFTQ